MKIIYDQNPHQNNKNNPNYNTDNIRSSYNRLCYLILQFARK